jgi:hypothetical protein
MNNSEKKRGIPLYILLIAVMTAAAGSIHAQPEVKPWGNLTGIRVEGQPMEVSSNIMVAWEDLENTTRSAKEQQRPRYSRTAEGQEIRNRLGNVISVEQVVEDAGTGKATMGITCSATKDTTLTGVFLGIGLTEEVCSNRSVEIRGVTSRLFQPSILEEGDRNRGMEEQGQITVSEGKVRIMLDQTSFTSLITN